MRQALLVTILGAGFLLGCDDGTVGADYAGAPLIAVNGVALVQSSGYRPTAPLGAALIWREGLFAGGQSSTVPAERGRDAYGEFSRSQSDETGSSRVAQETTIDSNFPASFQLAVADLPPAEVLSPVSELWWWNDGLAAQGFDPQVRVAGASLVIYTDGNGNGQLDRVHPDGPATSDAIVGHAAGIFLLYVEGGVAPLCPTCPGTLQPGFTLWDENGVRILPTASPIDVTLDGDAQYDRLNRCATQRTVSESTEYSLVDDLPAFLADHELEATSLSCSADAEVSGFSYHRCDETEEGNCSFAVRCLDVEVQLPSGELPANWPCPPQG